MKGLRLTNRRCECPTCGECFNSAAAFDRHRIPMASGDNSPWPRSARRCLLPLEMRGKGMIENSGGYWVSEQSTGWWGRTGE